MNSALNIIRIVLLAFIAVALTILLIVLLNGKIKIKGIDLYEKTELVYENTFTESISNLDIITTNNDVKIEEKEIENIEVKIYDRKDAKPTAEVKDNTLYIENKDEVRIGFSFGINGNSRIEITVPKGTTYNLKIDGTSSDVDSLINLKNVNIETKSGDVNLKNSIDTTINTTSGDITVGNTDKLEITTTSGDIKTGSVKESIYAKATSGDFLLGDINGKLTLNTTSGDIKINKVNLTNDSTVKVTSGDVVIGETNDIYIDAHVVSGDVKVNTNNRKSDYELKINTTSGDIIVNN